MSGLTRVEVGWQDQVIGPDIDLMLDCWLALDVEFAVRLAGVCAYHLRWIEDALVPDNLDAHGTAGAPELDAHRNRRTLVYA